MKNGCQLRQANSQENVYVTDSEGHIMLYQIRYDATVGVTASILAEKRCDWRIQDMFQRHMPIEDIKIY